MENPAYDDETLAKGLQKCFTQNEIPKLIFQTTKIIVEKHPKLSGFVFSKLQDVLSKKLWEKEDIWKDYINLSKVVNEKQLTTGVLSS